MLLFLDHILYRRAHFIHDALCASRTVLAIMQCLFIFYTGGFISLLIITSVEGAEDGPQVQCRLGKKYCKTSYKPVECENWKKRFRATCSELGNVAFEKLNWKLILGIAQTAKQTADCAAAQSWTVTRQCNVTPVKCGYIMNVHTFHSVMKLFKIQTASGYAQNVKDSTSLILILIFSAISNSQTGLIPWWKTGIWHLLHLALTKQLP